ncbi:MAG: hypothetical protein ACRC46_12530 [Thermoguttaceae bacterium]
MALLQSNPFLQHGSMGPLASLQKNVSRLVLIDCDSLPPARKYTSEEIERDPELKFLLNFPVATDDEILAIEEAIKEVNQWKTV